MRKMSPPEKDELLVKYPYDGMLDMYQKHTRPITQGQNKTGTTGTADNTSSHIRCVGMTHTSHTKYIQLVSDILEVCCHTV